MIGTRLCGLTLAGFLAFAAQSMAQTTTTGMVGFTTTQTARLSVLNLNPVATPATSTANNCSVELQFFDENNKLLTSTSHSLAPQTAYSFDLKGTSIVQPSTVAAVPGDREEIRGVVTVIPVAIPVATANPIAAGSCTLFTTLEIYDSTGSTVVLTSDTRPVPAATVVPLTAVK
jgi:hypothetical protein